MKFRNIVLMLGAIFLLISAGCSPAATVQPTTAAPVETAVPLPASVPVATATLPAVPPPVYQGFGLDKLDEYTATSDLKFVGAKAWGYTLVLRKAKDMLEYNLHIEGLDASTNPGDIRLVTDGKTSRVIGPGTDNECILFPAQSKIAPSFYTPDKLIAAEILAPALKPAARSAEDDPALAHVQNSNLQLQDWGGVALDMWLARENAVVSRFEFSAAGIDPIFKTGQGMLIASYNLKPGAPGTIEPVSGCEVEWPLPDGQANLVRMAGIVSFDTTLPADKVMEFYKDALEKAGWKSAGAAAVKAGVTAARYTKEKDAVDLTIETSPVGSTVKLVKSVG